MNAYAVSYLDGRPTAFVLADSYEADLFDLTFLAGGTPVCRIPVAEIASLAVRPWSWVARTGSSPEELQASLKDGAWRMDRDLRIAN
jgi:hypothetical protein